jgi:hypothetical protein
LVYLSVLLFPNSSVLCICPNQRNLSNLIVFVMVGFFNNCINFIINIIQFSFSLYTGPRILLYTFLSKMFNCFYLCLLVSRFMMHRHKCVEVCPTNNPTPKNYLL